MKGIKLKKAMAGIMVSVFTVMTLVTPANAATTKDKKTKDLERKVVGYFPEWAYKSEVQGNFDVADLQWESLTHIQYSFAMVGEDNKIAFGDKYAAIEEDFSKYKLERNGKEVKLDPKLPYKGHFNVLQQMKKEYPNVDLLISIGGWTGTRGFYKMIDTDAGINTFADSCVDFIRQYGFDGVDIDFEYPSSVATSGNPADKDLSEPRRAVLNERYNVLMKTLREKLDAASKKDNEDYLLTAAVTASSWVLGGVTDNKYASYLDFLSIMSYDFHGGWNEYVENLANIYPDKADNETTNMAMPTLNMDWAYNFYRGVLPAEKILMGIPYYTRGWENVQGGNGSGLHGKSKTPASGEYNLWGDDDNKDGKPDPAGANPLWHVLNLMEKDPNLKVNWDDVGKVPYVWQGDKKVFLSFENEQSIDERVKYIENKNLGGALIWVMNGDYGLNPNYVKGSDKTNEGKYTWGDTLTKKLKVGLDKMGNCKETKEDIGKNEVIDVNVDTKIKYDHPNGETIFTITNNTGATLPKGWEIQFDMPKSALYVGAEGGTGTVTEVGDFYRVNLKTSGWADTPNGGTASVKAKMKLCFSGVRNIKINGKIPASEPINGNRLPTLKGAKDQVVVEGSSFDVMTGISANDVEDGNITSNIVASGIVDTKKVGTYKVNYSITDKAGIIVTKDVIIYVVSKEHSSAVIWNSGTTYTNKQKVVYEGKIYENISWWTPAGTLPTSTAHYKVIS
ncbi:DUF5011 domain-containing protein [Clostridium gasigenes]|uniref:glycosyl hydrolase family 18 protein n=1 Tax=Clostridium gasigenes TaxID=94869 RepID=UPI00143835C3|nr:glycosyl hydrolase family 18 protein [Clostridium gasigenes]NKF05582.1 DUF5011 domain-containing protein [Clostridium gasigenes]QSW19024.1 DUF5011 domain-containing protein [Clostridium gasigenes]